MDSLTIVQAECKRWASRFPAVDSAELVNAVYVAMDGRIDGQPPAYLRKIVENKCKDILRRTYGKQRGKYINETVRRRVTTQSLNATMYDPPTNGEQEAVDVADALEKLMAHARPSDQRFLTLYYIRGMTMMEAAREMGWRLNRPAVSMRHTQIMRRLRAKAAAAEMM